MPARAFAHCRIVLFLCLCVSWSCLLSAADTDEPDFSTLAVAFRKHCVRVYIHGKTFEGRDPAVGELATDITNERPTPVGGYWWDERHVIIEDPVLQDQFIRSIEIGLPYSDQRYPARVAGRFVSIPAILLEVLPGESDIMPQAFPLQFDDGDLEDCLALSYVWDHGEWRIRGDMWAGPVSMNDEGSVDMELGASGILFTEDGTVAGIAFGDRVAEATEAEWSGATVPMAELMRQEEMENAHAALRQQLTEAVLETRFHLRVRFEDDEDEDTWSIALNDNSTGLSEVKAAGLVIGPRHLFVPVPLNAETIARIERIAIVLPDGRELTARFVGACREYEAVVVETEEDVNAANLPPGFAMLNPLVVPEEAFQPEETRSDPDGKLFLRCHIDYQLGRRRELRDYDRWRGTFRGFRGDPVVLTGTNERDGAFAFDRNGRLIALAITPRVLPARDGDGNRLQVSTGFRPLAFLHSRLTDSAVFDPTLAPVEEEDGRRLVDLGVEYQGLDANTARLFNAAAETRGGRIGMLVTYVYPDSTADRIGLREHDILLRLTIEGRNEPVELVADDTSPLFTDFEDMSQESIQQMLSYMPPPWPARENTLSLLLTGAGVGRHAELHGMREGEPFSLQFVTEYTAPDYRNAARSRFRELGLTIKPVTYEVARYFQRPGRTGVIVAKVEEGGKASVAGMYPYQLITRVDGESVAGVDDFTERVERFESGESLSIELTVESFGKTRLIRVVKQ